jgi:predicted transcriptional regulator
MKETDIEVEGCCPFDNLLPENFEKFSDNLNLTKRINYSAIANFTGLDKETVRRIVAKLVKKEWLVLDAQNKIIFKPSAENREMLTQLNSFEVNSLNVFVGRLHNN